jgi:hypothetical protein
MNMQNQFNVCFECKTISENIHKLKQEEFKDFQVIPGHSRPRIFVFKFKFKVIQGPCYTIKVSVITVGILHG